jgi:acetyl-CoA acetyltransferase
MPKTVILGSARTPIGKMGGGLSTLDATELGSTAIAAALERSAVEPEQVEHVIMGQVLQAGQGQIPSRQAQIKAGIPKEVSSETRRSAPGTSRSASAAAWSRCPRRPTCCRRPASATAWATPRCSTRWSTTA